jgi:ammonia channel protein AmtB
MKSREFILTLLITLAVIGLRFLPHPVNFSGTLALMIYAGRSGRNQRLLWILTPLLVLASDYFLGMYDGISMVYAAYAFCLISGMLIARGRFISFFFSGLISSAVFFVLSNYGVWNFTSLYPHDQMGLLQCYVMALPFFHNTVVSTMGGLAFMLGLRALVLRRSVEGLQAEKV